MSEMSLDDVLSGEESVSEEEASTGEEEQATAATETEGETEEGKSESADKADDKPDEKEEPKDIMVPLAAQLDERERRQKAEARADELEKQLKSQEPDETKVDPVADPDGFQASVDQRIAKALFQQDLKWMARTHDDWNEAYTWINEQLGDNVALQNRLAGSDSLLDDAYKMYQDHKKLQELESVDDIRERIREEVRAELLQEQEKGEKAERDDEEKAQAATEKPSVVTSGTSQSIGQTGEMTLEDVIGADIRSRPK